MVHMYRIRTLISGVISFTQNELCVETQFTTVEENLYGATSVLNC